MRVICLDYGKKRTGIAVTDAMRIIATSLGTVDTKELMAFLKDYFARESVSLVLIGYPLNLDNSPTHATPLVEGFMRAFRRQFPSMPIEPIDERYSSKMASQAISGMGLKKKDREQKGIIDAVSAVMLLQEWMNSNSGLSS
jgi:putative Holliday junction resolvase